MRKIVVALSALLLVLGTAHAAEAKGRAKYRVSISAPSSVMSGQTVHITGRVSPNAAGHRVSLQKKIPGQGGYRTESRSRVRADGTYSFTDKPTSRHTRYYRVQIGKAKKIRAGASKAKKVRVTKKRVVTPKLSITGVSARTLDAGQSVTVTGRASTTVQGQIVYLEAGAAGAWSAIGSTRVKSNGSITITAPVTAAGASVPLRLHIAGSKYVRDAASGATAVTVYGWYFLSDLDTVDESRWGYPSTTRNNINGVTYDKTVWSSDNVYNKAGWAEWDLGRKCRTFDTTVGLGDDSDANATRHGRITADTVDKWSRTNIALGQAFPTAVDLSGVLRLRLAATGGENDARLGFGNARVLCAM